MTRLFFKGMLFGYRILTYRVLASIWNHFALAANGVKIGKGWVINGFITIEAVPGSSVEIGERLRVNSGTFFNNIGRQQKTSLICSAGGVMTIGHNVGMSSATIVCYQSVKIGDNVRIGGNTVIYDTDFHSLNAEERTSVPEIKTNIRKSPVLIARNVFVGAHTTILKGTEIGENSIIGACSVVRGAKIPANQIWAGNPAVFIKELKTNDQP